VAFQETLTHFYPLSMSDKKLFDEGHEGNEELHGMILSVVDGSPERKGKLLRLLFSAKTGSLEGFLVFRN